MQAGPAAARALRDRAAVLLAFDQLGAAERALEMARGYVMQRRTFGRIVASYQAVKHRLADVWVRNQLARSHAYHGAWALAHAPHRLPLAAAGARVAAREALEFAAQENLQLHGGIGFTWEADCHPLYKRARSTALALGPAGAWKRRIAGELAAAA
jgi:acyl-CoA dehydrogenase